MVPVGGTVGILHLQMHNRTSVIEAARILPSSALKLSASQEIMKGTAILLIMHELLSVRGWSRGFQDGQWCQLNLIYNFLSVRNSGKHLLISYVC